jgi:four helix bundle suffix protein
VATIIYDATAHFVSASWMRSRTVDQMVQAARAVGHDRTDRSDRTDPTATRAAYARWLDARDAGVVANALLCLIHQANYLLDQQTRGLERDFVRDGGYTERLAAARVAERRKSPQTTEAAPACPLGGKPLVVRTSRKGPETGSQFWGCSGYPACKGTREIG